MPSPDSTAGSPLSEATFLILLSLSAAPRHGYGILKEVERLSDGRIVLGTGTLYGGLKRLLDAGWIERAGGDTDDAATGAVLRDRAAAGRHREAGRVRKVYALTARGRRVLDAEVDRLRQLIGAVRRLHGSVA
jgi:DNA-binding PadR family transcriptional regulator